MISLFQKIVSYMYPLINLPDSNLNEVDWELALPNDKTKGFAVFVGFAAPIAKNGEVNLGVIVAAFDVVDSNETGRIVLQLDIVNLAFEKGYMKLAQLRL